MTMHPDDPDSSEPRTLVTMMVKRDRDGCRTINMDGVPGTPVVLRDHPAVTRTEDGNESFCRISLQGAGYFKVGVYANGSLVLEVHSQQSDPLYTHLMLGWFEGDDRRELEEFLDDPEGPDKRVFRFSSRFERGVQQTLDRLLKPTASR